MRGQLKKGLETLLYFLLLALLLALLHLPYYLVILNIGTKSRWLVISNEVELGFDVGLPCKLLMLFC